MSAEIGIEFVYDNGATGEKLMVEATGGGAGWLDYDGDGRPDLYLVQGGDPVPGPEDQRLADCLYRNTGDGRFVEVAQSAGVGETGYGQGVAVGDFNHDGFDDIYVTNVGHNALYQNQGDGTFQDVTAASGVDDRRWSSSAAWGDLDLDGDLDLFVCNYVDYDPRHPKPCRRSDGTPGICHPNEMDAVPNECFFNQGDGTFRPLAASRGLRGEGSKSLGVVIADFNADSRPDLYVANDTTANFLFIGDGSGHFEDKAVTYGCALSGRGDYQASMGIAFGDYDRNGLPDLYITHFTADSNTLYSNLGSNGFYDATRSTGLHQPTLQYLGFGTVMADFNHDACEDLFVTNGHIGDWRYKGDLYHMPPQLFSFVAGRWTECGRQVGEEIFQTPRIGRGVAACDYDEDGDLDLAVVHQNARTAILRNESTGGHWLQVKFIGRRSNRRGIGVRATLQQGETELVQQLPGGVSYCASHEPALNFGLGMSTENCHLEVHWPSGAVQTVDVAVDQTLVLVEPAE